MKILTTIIGLVFLTGITNAQTNAWYNSLLQGTNYATALYGDYFQNSHKIGGGLLELYNINNPNGALPGTAAGVGLDWCGQWELVSANAQLRYTIQRGKLSITPFGIVGFGSPIGGAQDKNGALMTAEGGGVALDYPIKTNLTVGAGYAGIVRQNAGDVGDGLAHTLFIKIIFNF